MKQQLIKPALISIFAICIALVAFNLEKKEPAPVSNEQTTMETGNGYTWKRITASADFGKSYNFQLLAHNNQLWAFHPDGNYYSTDGKSWTKSSLTNSIHNLAFLDYVYYRNAVYGLGHFTGNIERFELTTPITRTDDFRSWQTVSTNNNLPKRFFYASIVFNDKIWLFGGSDGQQEFDDAWTSVDGVNWKQEITQLPFGEGSKNGYLVFNNKLYHLANDVWASEDGIHWKPVSPRIHKETLVGYTPVVFDNKIWLLGCNRNGQFASKVLVSSDGANWEEQDAPWSPRGGIAACVFNGKLYITGGKYGGLKNGETAFVYSNDVWVLEKNTDQRTSCITSSEGSSTAKAAVKPFSTFPYLWLMPAV